MALPFATAAGAGRVQDTPGIELALLTWEGAGSRMKFVKEIKGVKHVISLHKPHPGNEVKEYAQKDVVEKLEEVGDL
jgi:hypothetical protein